MRRDFAAWALFAIVALLACTLRADEPAGKAADAATADASQPNAVAAPADASIEQLTERARKSVVVVTQSGRDGKREGLGAGFVVSADGLIVTNFHVIGEGRPINVELADGRKFPVTAVHASDRALDLAVVRIDARDLPALTLGDSEALKQGQSVLAIGNPLGLKHSVVTGVVSGVREIEGRPMVQLAMPIEPGNSGGPLLDLQGRVEGILTLKSLMTANLGFAVGVNTLKPLLEKPNPIVMSRWLTIGALDPRQWQPLFGARWHQRAGRILVDGLGQGFGGRSLCLNRQAPPALPYEVSVNVKLNDEAGAAGLAFGSDGEHNHFGFYPTNGKMRFTRFDGPDVFSWKVLKEFTSRHYRPGQWNNLRVRLEADKISCFVNDQLVVESTEAVGPDTKVGLAKFRDTSAEFKNFRVGEKLASETPPAEQLQALRQKIDGLPVAEKEQEAVEALAPERAAAAVLRERAKSLDEQAAKLRRLAQEIHEHRVVAELRQAMKGDEADVDLFRTALLIAKLDNEELDVEPYLAEVRRMGEEIAGKLPKDADDQAKLDALRKYLFEENGFHGSRGDYYSRSNSYMNEVLDDREGLPITLSVLYMELAAKLDLKVLGLGLPGHFIVQHVPADGPPQLIDVYEGAKAMSREDAARRVRGIADRELADADLVPTTKRAILVRMLHNLQGVAAEARDAAGLLRYLNAMLALDSELPQERWMRAVVSFQLDRKDIARNDVAWLLEKMPPGFEPERLHEFQRLLSP